LAIFYIYGIDVTIKSVLRKGNFDQMRLEVENLSKISEVYLSTKDYHSYSRLFSRKVHHLFSRFFNLPDSNIGKILTSAIFFGLGFVSIMKRVKKIDVIVSQGTASLQGAIANVLFHKPVILYLQYFAYNEQALLRRSFLSLLFRWLEFFSMRHCNIVIAPNERLEAEAFANGAKFVQIIPNFVSTREIGKISNKGVLRDKLGIDRNACVVLFVGRLHPVKNLALVLRSFGLLDKLDNSILVLVGDGPEKQRLMDLALNLGINDRVRFEGFQPKKTVLEYMKASDVLVLPSKVEGQSRVILEAWACELPVVASNVSGIKNLVTNGFDGLLFNLPSEKQFAQAISKALEIDVANELRVNARKQLARYSKDSVLFQQAVVVRKFLPKFSVG
jgi:glycosyltransferase involved in cell wall biosynthesis